ncbi:MAG: DMT family transporter [bacterium]
MERRGFLFILLSAACFGSGSIFARFAYDGGINVYTLLAMRFTIAASALYLYCRLTRTNLRLGRRDLRIVLLLGGVGYAGMAFLYFGSIQYIPVSLVALLTYTYPSIVTVLAFFLLHESLDRIKVFALLLASAGCALTVWSPGLTVNLYGAALACTASFVYSFYIIAASKYTSHLDAKVMTFYITLSCAVVYVGYGAAAGRLDFGLPAGTFAAVAALALFTTVLGNIFFFCGLHLLGASRTALLSTVEPFYTVLLATLLFREAITLTQIGGGLLIVGAVILLNRRRETPAASEQSPGTSV